MATAVPVEAAVPGRRGAGTAEHPVAVDRGTVDGAPVDDLDDRVGLTPDTRLLSLRLVAAAGG